VSVLIVEQLEPIEVDRQQRGREVGGGGAHEGHAVEHAGHRIDAGAIRHDAQLAGGDRWTNRVPGPRKLAILGG
jgi:hypothetical protein